MAEARTSEGIAALAAFLRERDDIALLGHVSPDGDAAGSCIALALALKALGKRAAVLLPGGVPLRYAFLPGAGEALDPEGELPFVPRAALAVDVADEARLGPGAELFLGCPDRGVLDHHGSNPGFAALSVVDGSRAAAGELVLELIRALGVTLSREMAECLFVAISTDSGNFNFDCTTPETLRAAADCVAAGADVERLTRLLYRTRRVEKTRLIGAVLSDLRLEAGGRIAYARVTEDMYAACGALREDTDSIVNFLIEAEGVSLAFLAEQRGETTKFSLRSLAPYDVSEAARDLGGGGHQRAAGATLEEPMERAIPVVLERMKALLEGR